MYRVNIDPFPPLAVRVPCQDQHQIQSQEAVVRRFVGAGNECGRGGQTAQLYTKKGL